MNVTKEDKWVAALEVDATLSNEFLQDLKTAIEIDGHDCEEWSAKVGYAIVARLRRNRPPAANGGDQMKVLLTEKVYSDGQRHPALINCAHIVRASPVADSDDTYVELGGGEGVRIATSFGTLCRYLAADEL